MTIYYEPITDDEIEVLKHHHKVNAARWSNPDGSDNGEAPSLRRRAIDSLDYWTFFAKLGLW